MCLTCSLCRPKPHCQAKSFFWPLSSKQPEEKTHWTSDLDWHELSDRLCCLQDLQHS